MTQLNQLKVLPLVMISTLAACAVEGDAPATDDVEQHATAFFIEGKFRRLTDSFSEQCGEATVKFGTTVNTGVKKFADDGHAYNVLNIPRGFTTSVFPAHAVSGNHTIPWFCGNDSEWSECTGPESVLRVKWSLSSREITVQCFATCGDGSSASDCAGL